MFKNIADIAQIIIALGAIFSIYLGIKSLAESKKNSAMNTAPTLILTPKFNKLMVGDRVAYTLEESQNDYSVHIWVEFIVRNVGRGVALEIKDPNIFVGSSAIIHPEYKPVFLEAGESFSFFTISNKKFSDCRAMYVDGKHFNIGLELSYKNDQGNIAAQSSIEVELQPFVFQHDILSRAEGAEIVAIKKFKVDYKFLN